MWKQAKYRKVLQWLKIMPCFDFARLIFRRFRQWSIFTGVSYFLLNHMSVGGFGPGWESPSMAILDEPEPELSPS
jgi:hypothetical protein